MIINEIDKDTLKELRGILFEKKKAQERVIRDMQRIKADEEYRRILSRQKDDAQNMEMDRS